MATIAFWNLGQRTAAATVASFVHENGVEILAVAEQGFTPTALTLAFSQRAARSLFPLPVLPVPGWPTRLHLYSTFTPDRFRSISDGHVLSSNRYDQIQEYRPSLGNPLLLVAVHLQSKLHLDERAQGQLGTRLRPRIAEAEQKVGHQRTIVFGDFNMSPFETGMVSSEALHSVMDRRIAAKARRQVSDEERVFFYNPMWRLMGNSSVPAPGTLYYTKSDPVQYFWNTFDQVLIRPELLSGFDDRTLSIVTQIGRESLLATSGLGTKKKVSDHLPIVFTVNT